MSHLVLGLILAGAASAAPAENRGPENRAPQDQVSAPPDTVVVAAKEFLPALSPWVEHRTAQGRRVTLVSNAGSAETIRAAIRAAAPPGGVRYILLVGDARPPLDVGDAAGRLCIPAHTTRAVVNVQFGSEPEIATDNLYADFDDDGAPDAAIGRLPVDSPDELSLQISKIIAYESAANGGAWRRRLNFVAGVGGFGTVADSVLEFATKKFLTDGVPPAYATTMTYGSWQSPYCPDPRRFHEATLERLNEGCLFWVYIGHGHRRGVDRVQTPHGEHPILEANDADKIACRQGAPIAIFLACYTGAYDAPQDCLGELLLRQPGGPVAVLAGSRVTMPYSMAVLAHGMMDEYFVHQRATLGDIVLNAKRRLVDHGEGEFTSNDGGGALLVETGGETTERSPDSGRIAVATAEETRRLIDAVGAVVSPSGDQLPAERAEHLALFNLLGDPLLRLPQPEPIAITAANTIRAGDPLDIRGTAPLAGRYTVELVCRRDLSREPFSKRRDYDPSPDVLARFHEVYERANDPVWISRAFDSPGGEFRLRIPTPPAAAGSCHVRVFAEGENRFALGSANVYVEPAVRQSADAQRASSRTSRPAPPANPIRRSPR